MHRRQGVHGDMRQCLDILGYDGRTGGEHEDGDRMRSVLIFAMRLREFRWGMTPP